MAIHFSLQKIVYLCPLFNFILLCYLLYLLSKLLAITVFLYFTWFGVNCDCLNFDNFPDSALLQCKLCTFDTYDSTKLRSCFSFMQGGEEQTNESEESSQTEDDGTTLEDIKVKKMQFLSPAVLLRKFLICVST